MNTATSLEVASKVYDLLNFGYTKVLSDDDAMSVAHLTIDTITKEEDLEILSLICNNRLLRLRMDS